MPKYFNMTPLMEHPYNTTVLVNTRLKGSVTVRYIFVYCRFMSLFSKKSIRLRYIKLHIDTFVMIVRTLS